MRRFWVVLVCLSPWATALAEEISFIEDFVLAKDRANVLKGLVPSTEDYFYYHALHYLNTEQYGKAEALFGPWLERFGETPRLTEIRVRLALLTYERKPAQALQVLRHHFKVDFPHEREDASQSPNVPTRLDPQLISRDTLLRHSFERWTGLDNFEDASLDWLAAHELTPERRRLLLQRVTRPDVPNLVRHIDADLRVANAPPFGAYPIHQHLTLAQLEDLLKLRPALLHETNFVHTWVRKLQPGADEDWRRDPAVTAGYLDRLVKFVRRLSPAHASLKAHVLYHRLAFGRAQGQMDKALFLEYLRLPRRRPYVSQSMWEAMESSRVTPADLDMSFAEITMLPPVGDDEALVRGYLEHFMLSADSPQEFLPYINDVYLRHLFAEVKIVNGLGEPERWAAQLPPELYQQIRDRVDVDFAATSKVYYAADEPVSLDVYVKNVPTLLVKVFEINAEHWYRTQQREVDANINLDGLVAGIEETKTYSEPPQRRMLRRLEFPQLTRPGVYVIDLIGGGKASRAVIRKGRLRPLVMTTSAGQLVRIVDDQNQPVPDATLWLGGREFRPDKDGAILVPFSTAPGLRPVVISARGFSCLESLHHQGEQYSFLPGIYVDREALLAQRVAALIIRPTLLLNGVALSLRDLENIRLRITAIDCDGVATTTEVADIKLHDNRETVHEFRVPNRLAQLRVLLLAQIKSLTQHRLIDLSGEAVFNINGIVKHHEIADVHLIRFGKDYVLEMLGRTGERRTDRPMTISLKHRLFKEPVQVTLKTDSHGRIFLGELQDIDSISLTTPAGVPRSWQLPRDQHTYPPLLHVRAGTSVSLPFFGDTRSPSRAELALFEVRDKNIRTDRFDLVHVSPGLLELRDLPAGDYVLSLKEQRQEIYLRAVAGEESGQFVLGRTRLLELPPLKPAVLTGVEADDKHVTIRLQAASPLTRVHVFASRFVPEFSSFEHLQGTGIDHLGGLLPAAAESTYLTGRQLGDELRYVLDRKLQPKHPGNMLTRPTLLLNPWAKRETIGGEQLAAAGDDFSPVSPQAPSAPAEKPLQQSSPIEDKERQVLRLGPNYDFLAEPTVSLLNLVPDQTGTIKLPREQLKSKGYLQVVVVDPVHTTVRQVSLPEQPAAFLDLRLPKSLQPQGHFTLQKQVSIVPANQPFVLADATSSRFEAYDSLGKVFTLYQTLLKDPQFADLAFVTRWPTLKPEEQRTLYSKYACHELNFFLFKKDPRFFQEVIRPYLAHKKDKTFLDLWLLEADIQAFSSPWAYGRLNALERILLAQRQPNEPPVTARHLRDLWRLVPRDLAREQFLYESAIARGAMEKAQVLASTETGKLPLLDGEKQVAEAPLPPQGGVPRPAAPGGIVADPAVPDAGMGQAAAAGRHAGKAGEREARDKAAARLDAEESRKKELQHFRANERGRRQLAAPLYRPVAPTQEWAENNWHHVPVNQHVYHLLPVNRFWLDYAQHDPAKPFLSTYLAEAARHRAEALCALAVLDLPFSAAPVTVKFDGNQMTWQSTGPAIVFHEEVKPVPAPAGNVPILVSQHFFRQDDRYREDAGERLDKFVTEEFLTHVVYGCQVVVTNPTPARQRLSVLFQVPAGAIPVQGGQPTQTIWIELDPYRTQLLDFFFYFPRPGRFSHFPVHIAKNEQLVASAAPFVFNVVDTPSKVDVESWDYLSQHGTNEQVLAYLNRENVAALNLDRIAWRMKDKAFFTAVLQVLTARRHYHHTLWSYGLLHNDPPAIQEFLQHHPQTATLVGGPIRSPLLNLDPIARHEYEHLEYQPLVNARAHRLGFRRQILNRALHDQYHRFLKLLSYRPRLSADDSLALVYYLILQDRIDEAREIFAQVSRDQVATRMQYDYLAAYLALSSDSPSQARALATPYAQHPVDRWRQAFAAVLRQLDEIEGAAAAAVDPMDQTQRQSQLAAEEPTFDFTLDNQTIHLAWQNLERARINFYLMDLELLFSRSPFVQQGDDQFRSIRPNRSEDIKLPPGQNRLAIPLPRDLISRQVLVEIVAGGKSRALPYYSSAMTVQLSENYGQLKVTDLIGKPLPKVYVKTYVRLANGMVKFHKDGYTDHRGRFDYATVSTPEQQGPPQRYAILIISEDRGALIREAAPPPR